MPFCKILQILFQHASKRQIVIANPYSVHVSPVILVFLSYPFALFDCACADALSFIITYFGGK